MTTSECEREKKTIASGIMRRNDFIAFTSIFDFNAAGWADGVELLKLSELSIASAINLKAPFIVLTHTSFPLLGSLYELTKRYDYLSVEAIPDAELSLNKSQWVAAVEKFKVHFLKKNEKAGTPLVYVELDQLFLPGSGQNISKLFNNDDFSTSKFDVGFTYNNKPGGKFGSVNTGVIFFRAGRGVTHFFEAMLRELLNRHSVTYGGENQKVIDSFVPFLEHGQTHLVTLDGETNVTVQSFAYPGPYNFNTPGCCKMQQNVFVAHFKSLKKNFILSACCRDLVFPERDDIRRKPWLTSCDCNQANASTNAVCFASSGDLANGTEPDSKWCET